VPPPGQTPEGILLPTLLSQPVPGPIRGGRRLHLDLDATDRDQETELA
jgi:hypothetical protein